MGEALTLIGALLPFVVQELQALKVVSPQLGALITGIEGAAGALVTQITNQSTGKVTVTAVSLLAGINAAIVTLQAQTTIDPKALAITSAFGQAVSAGLAASAVTSVDVTKLQPIAPIA